MYVELMSKRILANRQILKSWYVETYVKDDPDGREQMRQMTNNKDVVYTS